MTSPASSWLLMTRAGSSPAPGACFPLPCRVPSAQLRLPLRICPVNPGNSRRRHLRLPRIDSNGSPCPGNAVPRVEGEDAAAHGPGAKSAQQSSHIPAQAMFSGRRWPSVLFEVGPATPSRGHPVPREPVPRAGGR